MSNLSSTLSSFRVPEASIENLGIHSAIKNFIIELNEVPTIHQGSIIIEEIGVLADENKLIIDQLKSFKFLEENWDGDGALRIPNQTIDKAINLINKIDKLNNLVYLCSPGPNEEVLLILKNGTREIELIIYPNKEKHVKFEENNYVEQGSIQGEEFNLLIDWIS